MMAETAAELCKRPEIRKELERATGQNRREKIETNKGDKFWVVGYTVVLALCAVLYFLIGAKVISLPESAFGFAQRILRGAALITIVLAVARATSVYGITGVDDAATRFTLQRITRLVVALAVAVIIVSVVFVIGTQGWLRWVLARSLSDWLCKRR